MISNIDGFEDLYKERQLTTNLKKADPELGKRVAKALALN